MARPRPLPDPEGYFGRYGGRYVPETLMAPLAELTRAYDRARRSRGFRRELTGLLNDFAGRPTPLYFAERLSEELGGARIFLKREDLLHTGAHKINNAVGQCLLTRADGQGAGDRRDRRRPARRRHRHRRRARSASPASSTWAARTCAASGSTSTACACSAPRWCRSTPAAARSRTPSTRRCATG